MGRHQNTGAQQHKNGDDLPTDATVRYAASWFAL
jgi:hypothetical protein